MTIDIGTTPGDFNTSLAGGAYTVLNPDNPANDTGVLDTVKVWSAVNITDLKVGTFYHVSISTYKCRDSESVGGVTAGAERTFTVSLNVQAGDLIGCYYADGSPEFNYDGETGEVYYFEGEAIDPNDQADYDVLALKIALSGSGYSILTRSAVIKIGVKVNSSRTKVFIRSSVIKIGVKINSGYNRAKVFNAKVFTTQYRSVRVFTTMYRRIKNFLTRG